MYEVVDSETGVSIDEFWTKKEAYLAIREYEKTDNEITFYSVRKID